MISKIVSGGQTGVDRAALDVAIKLGISHGGWVPKGRKAEDGIISDKYLLIETPTEDYKERTEQNVKDSNGTLIISRGALTEGSAFTRDMATKYKRPWIHVDLEKTNAFKAAQDIRIWIVRQKVKILNVAGPRASNDARIYELTMKVLEAVFYLDMIEVNMPDRDLAVPLLPRRVEEAVERLIAELPLKDRIGIAKMTVEELGFLDPSLGEYIRGRFELWGANSELLKACSLKLNRIHISEYDASLVIIKALWETLRETHALRVIH
jgi:hypothetical protein